MDLKVIKVKRVCRVRLVFLESKVDKVIKESVVVSANKVHKGLMADLVFPV